MQDPEQPAHGGELPAPTVEDVAAAAGVSRQTVSNVLNAPHRVRPETRQRVEEAIAATGYQPNRVARALRVHASRLIGYRIEPVGGESLSNMHDRFLHALAEAGRAVDHHLLMFTADDADDEIAACARLWRTGGADGFVLYGISHDDPRPPRLLSLGVPFAVFGRSGRDSDHPWVDVDNVAGTAAVVDHLVARGHRRIAYVGSPEGDQAGDRRAEGWRTTLDKHGLLAEGQELDVRAEDSIDTGARLCAYLLDRDAPPTAVVASTDTLAVGAVHAARIRGLTIGSDLAVVGFDDTPTARALDLSSVRQPIELVGRAIIQALLARLPSVPAHREPEGASAPKGDAVGGAEAPGEEAAWPATSASPTGRLLKPSLVVRASSAAPAPRPFRREDPHEVS